MNNKFGIRRLFSSFESFKKMWCFSNACTRQIVGDFICSCNKTKFFCEKHEDGLNEQKKSCQIGWKCVSCRRQAGQNNLQFLSVYSKNDAKFLICSECAIQELDPWIASRIKEEKEIIIAVAARQGAKCDICSAVIISHNTFDLELFMQKTGWVWNDGYLKYTYCTQCLSNACSFFFT